MHNGGTAAARLNWLIGGGGTAETRLDWLIGVGKKNYTIILRRILK